MNRDGANGGGGENLRVRKPPAQGYIREEEQLHRHLHWLPQRALRCTNSHILIIGKRNSLSPQQDILATVVSVISVSRLFGQSHRSVILNLQSFFYILSSVSRTYTVEMELHLLCHFLEPSADGDAYFTVMLLLVATDPFSSTTHACMCFTGQINNVLI